MSATALLEKIKSTVTQAERRPGTWVEVARYSGANHYQHAKHRADSAGARVSKHLELSVRQRGEESVVVMRWLAIPRQRRGADR